MDFQQTITNLHLLDAIVKKDLSKIEELLNLGADVNFKNVQDINNTSLHYAASANAPEIVQLLLERSADVGATNDEGKTPLDLLPSPPSSAAEGPILTYFKRPGTASILGQWYESKLLAMVLFRAVHWERISSFFLATNVDDAGAFDDVVIRYTEGGVDRLVFLQAKHKPGKGLNLRDVLKSVAESGDFSLAKYFESFLFIMMRCHESNQSAIFKDVSQGTVMEFIIFTTLFVDYSIPKNMNILLACNKIDENSLFYTCPAGRSISLVGLLERLMTVALKWYRETLVDILAKHCLEAKHCDSLEMENSIEIFLISIENDGSSFKFLQLCYAKVSSFTVPRKDHKKFNEIKKEITKILTSNKFETFNMSDEDCINYSREFFNKLKFYTMQSTESEVEQIVQREIPLFHPTPPADINLTFQMYHLAVQQWWLQTGDVPFQTKSSQLFREAQTAVEKGSLLENLHLISMGELQAYKSQICPKQLSGAVMSEVQRFLDDGSSHTLPIVGGLIESCCARLVEFLASKDDVNLKFVNADVTNAGKQIGQLRSRDAVSDFLVLAHKEKIGQDVLESLNRNFRKIIYVTDKEQAEEVPSSSASGLMNQVQDVQEVQPDQQLENDEDSYRNRRKAFLRNFRKDFRLLLSSAGEQLVDLNMSKK